MRPSAAVPLFLVAALTVALPVAARACSCTNYPDFDRAYAQSDAIFLGEVLEVTSAAPGYYDAVWATVRVEAHWKGAPPETVRVLTGANDGNCGFGFQTGERYLVYAFRGEYGAWGGPPLSTGEVLTHLCWRTHGYWAGDPDLVSLGPVPVAVGSWGSVKVRYR